jgi:hypothetical protein
MADCLGKEEISLDIMSVFFQRYIEAEEAYRKVISLDSECEDARRQLLDVQALQLCELGYKKQHALKALGLTLNNNTHIADVEVFDVCCWEVNWFI